LFPLKNKKGEWCDIDAIASKMTSAMLPRSGSVSVIRMPFRRSRSSQRR
jgi:hypothetical protein